MTSVKSCSQWPFCSHEEKQIYSKTFGDAATIEPNYFKLCDVRKFMDEIQIVLCTVPSNRLPWNGARGWTGEVSKLRLCCGWIEADGFRKIDNFYLRFTCDFNKQADFAVDLSSWRLENFHFAFQTFQSYHRSSMSFHRQSESLWEDASTKF